MQSFKTSSKKLKSPDGPNPKTSITCLKVPDALFDSLTAKKHFSKFGRVQKIRLFPRRQVCIIDYEQPIFAERALLNAGAYDGFMFEVTRTKPKVRRKSKLENDPDWVPDSDVEEELSAMSGAPIYRITRQKPMDTSSAIEQSISMNKVVKPATRRLPVKSKPKGMSQHTSGTESPVLVPVLQTTLSTSDAALELYQLSSKISLTPDEQWRILDARDKILRSWGGAGARVKVGGATIGTCPDMCPEKERLHRQAEHQVMTLETVPDSDGLLELRRAVKQYSRSSADQEIPMCYELRPASVLMRTCLYLLHEIADTTRQVTLSDWFHFMWDRLRGIRKDITQQALCCAESIKLVEMCARFHAHCAARLADLEHTQFDQKLNTDNLTKCLQTLKHMYADVGPDLKPNEAEFRGYIALLNLGDSNFWWEIKQLPSEIQKSDPIIFAMQIFNALDNNNYVKFFRLINSKATYLQASILLRYFNDVRARALARIVKAYAPRGGARYPIIDIMNALAFESLDNLKCFITHYGLRLSKTDETELTVILDRNQFIEDSDPFPISRAIKLIESKRHRSVGETIYGGDLPKFDAEVSCVFSSFTKDGKLKESSLSGEDQKYNTSNDSNKDVKHLKNEIQKLLQCDKKSVHYLVTSEPSQNSLPVNQTESKSKNVLSFNAPIPLTAADISHDITQKIINDNTPKKSFSFSKPIETGFKMSMENLFSAKDDSKSMQAKTIFDSASFGKDGQNIFTSNEVLLKNNCLNNNANVAFENKNVFTKDEKFSGTNIGSKSIFALGKDVIDSKCQNNLLDKESNIFTKPFNATHDKFVPKVGTFNLKNPFEKTVNATNKDTSKSIFSINGDSMKGNLSPSTLFKTALIQSNGPETKPYSVFQSKNKSSVANNIFHSINSNQTDSVYNFDPNENVESQEQAKQRRLQEEQQQRELAQRQIEEQRILMERKRQEEEKRIEEEEKRKKEEEKRKKEEEKRKKEEEKRILEDLQRQEEKRRQEAKRREDLKKKIEEDRKAEEKRVAEEQRKFKEKVEKDSMDLLHEIVKEVEDETIKKEVTLEMENFSNLLLCARTVADDIIYELCEEISTSEMKAEKHLTDKLMEKWFCLWRKQYIRNVKRRNLLEDTPVWLTNTPIETAHRLKRLFENDILKNMNAMHRGYKFTGELRVLPSPEPFNLLEIIKSPLLKRMKQIVYPYDKCFFWKVALIPPDTKWLYKKIDMRKWLCEAFSDKSKHDTSDSLIHVRKQSWNSLMEFATSISLTSLNAAYSCSEAVEGANGLLFYTNENELNLLQRIDDTLKSKYPYQIIPIAVIIPSCLSDNLEQQLNQYVNSKVISTHRIFTLDSNSIIESLTSATKSALRWLAKNYPVPPLLEIDSLKSICQRYLGSELWCRLKSEQDNRIHYILKNFKKLIQLYNTAVNNLTCVITNENLFNYPSFPLEFYKYLDHTSPYPKPQEFIPSSVKNTGNIIAIKRLMQQLKLPEPTSDFKPVSINSVQEHIRGYCKQIEWFDNADDVACKVVAVIPNDIMETTSKQQFSHVYEQYDYIDFLNILIYEKICRLNNFDNLFAVYERYALDEYKAMNWLYDTKVLLGMKHKAIDYYDDLDTLIDAKRRKLDMKYSECLELHEKDYILVEKQLNATGENINKYNNCENAVKQLEELIEGECQKSMYLEELLKTALSDT